MCEEWGSPAIQVLSGPASIPPQWMTPFRNFTPDLPFSLRHNVTLILSRGISRWKTFNKSDWSRNDKLQADEGPLLDLISPVTAGFQDGAGLREPEGLPPTNPRPIEGADRIVGWQSHTFHRRPGRAKAYRLPGHHSGACCDRRYWFYFAFVIAGCRPTIIFALT